jgi:DNA polymerase-1
MFFAHDSERNFYYYGEIEPRAGLYTDYLTDLRVIAVDTETISLKERIAIGVGISPNPQMAFYFPLFPTVSPYTPWHLLKNPGIKKLFQNAPFDLLCLREYDIYNGNIGDTNVLAQLLNIRPSTLSDLASYMLINGGGYYEVWKVSDLLPKGQIMLDLPEEKVAMKCCQDAIATHAIHEFLESKVNTNYYHTEMELIPILVNMSFNGILLDQEVRARLEESLEKEVDYYIDLAHTDGFNPGSTQQVGYILAKRGAYSVFTRLPFTKGGRKGIKQLDTSKEVLEKMNDPLATMVLDYRDKSYLLSHYIKPWAGEERAYTRFHLDAITGRITSTDRNLQNIPKGETRNMFLPDSGMFTDVDYSQIELRVLAYLSGDREMQYIYESGGDIHQNTADFLGIPRYPAKSVNFAMTYGATDDTIMEIAHIKSKSRAKQLKEMWFEKYKEAGDYIQVVQEESIKNPYATTLFGRSIKLPDLEEESIGGIHRKAVNYPIQGSAAEIFKRALIRCKDLPIVLQIHDEMVFDGKVELPRLDNIASFQTPVEVKYLQCWE